MDILRFLSGSQGGDQQIAARIACNELDLLLMFRDPITVKPNELNEANILRLCDVHNVPVATNIATAEALIHALERGDLEKYRQSECIKAGKPKENRTGFTKLECQK